MKSDVSASVARAPVLVALFASNRSIPQVLYLHLTPSSLSKIRIRPSVLYKLQKEYFN